MPVSEEMFRRYPGDFYRIKFHGILLCDGEAAALWGLVNFHMSFDDGSLSIQRTVSRGRHWVDTVLP